MVKVYIDMTGNSIDWLYGGSDMWKEYVADDFDSKVVLAGNRDFEEVKSAEWYNSAVEVLKDIAMMDEDDAIDEVNPNWYSYRNANYTDEQIEQVKEIYKADYHYWENSNIALAATALVPGLRLRTATIRGYNQGEWQDVIYVENSIDLNQLESVYFGKVCDVYAIDGNDVDLGSNIIRHDELWKMERDDTLESGLRELFGLDDSDEIKVFKCEGYKQVPDWQEIKF